MEIAKRALAIEDSIIRSYSNLAKEKDDISLALGEPCFDTNEAIKKSTILAIDNNDTHYAPAKGKSLLIDKISKVENRLASEILITAGSSSAIAIALFTIIDPGDEVLIPIPTYSAYPPLCSLALGKVNYIDTSGNDFVLSKQLLEENYTEKTKLLIINTPVNPTGIVYSAKTMQEIVEFVSAKNIFLVLDSVYDLLQYDGKEDYSCLNQIKDQLIICKSFSKAYFMTGWRLGYMLASDTFIKTATKLHGYFATAVNSFIQAGAYVAFDCAYDNEYQQLKQNRDYAYKRITEMNLFAPKPSGGYFLFLNINEFKMDSKTFCCLLYLKTGVATIPGIAFNLDGYIRISYCCSYEKLAMGLDRIEKFITALRNQ